MFDKWRNPDTGTQWEVERPKPKRSVWHWVGWVTFACLISFCVAVIAATVSQAYAYGHSEPSYVSDGG